MIVKVLPAKNTTNAISQADTCSLIKPRIFGRTACNGIGNTHNASVLGCHFGWTFSYS